MNYRVFAMDTYFYTPLGVYELDVRCEMLKELGYDATYLTTGTATAWADVSRLSQAKARHGLDVAGVYTGLDLTWGSNHPDFGRLLRLVETLEGCDHIELSVVSSDQALKRSDPAGDDAAKHLLEQLLKTAARRGVTISLYPHFGLWLERVEDAVRLCRAFNHPQLRAVFCGFHWYAMDGQNIATRLDEAAPWLRSVNLCGSRRLRGIHEGMPATIEPLDEGELDNFAILGLLRTIGYRGMIGFQGFSVGGDVYAKLKRSLQAFRDMERRLNQHPHWTCLLKE